jgi:hypothetical protein
MLTGGRVSATTGQQLRKGEKMEQLNSALQSVAASLGPYAPRVIGALIIILAAWIVGRLVRAAVGRLSASLNVDDRLHSPGLSATLANLAYWLVWLFALPALLGTLELDGLLAPVNAMLSRLLGFLPNLFGAAVVFAIGFLAARIVRQVVGGLLKAAGSEKLAEKLGLASALGESGLSGLIGTIAFVLVLLPTVAAALQPLGLDSVTNPVSRMLDAVIGLIPKLASAAIIIVVAAVIGRSLADITSALLASIGLNDLPLRLGFKQDLRVGGRRLSQLAGIVVMVAVLMVAIGQACEVIGFTVLTQTVAVLGTVLAQLLVAALLLGAGLWLASVAARAIESSSVANAHVLSHVARGAILFFTAALAMRQAGLPAEIIAIAFGATVGAIAVGVAVAFGVGGRHLAGRLLEDAAAAMTSERGGSASKDA